MIKLYGNTEELLVRQEQSLHFPYSCIVVEAKQVRGGGAVIEGV